MLQVRLRVSRLIRLRSCSSYDHFICLALVNVVYFCLSVLLLARQTFRVIALL